MMLQSNRLNLRGFEGLPRGSHSGLLQDFSQDVIWDLGHLRGSLGLYTHRLLAGLLRPQCSRDVEPISPSLWWTEQEWRP